MPESFPGVLLPKSGRKSLLVDLFCPPPFLWWRLKVKTEFKQLAVVRSRDEFQRETHQTHDASQEVWVVSASYQS